MKTILLVSLFLLAGCGKNEEDLKYSFTENNCSTGEQRMNSNEQLCARLKDDAANQNCARSIRQQEFASRGCGAW